MNKEMADNINIVIDSAVTEQAEDMELEGGIAYHIRCEYNPETGAIKIPIVGKELIVVTISGGIHPLLGHPKTDLCCG